MQVTYHVKLLQRIINETPKAVGGLVLLSAIYVWVYKDFLPFFYLYLWVVLQTIFITLRFIHARVLNIAIQNNNIEKIEKLTKQFFILIVYSAVVWNIAVVLSCSFAPAYYEFITLIMISGSLTAGVLSLLPTFKIYMTYLFLMVTPQIWLFKSFDTHLHDGTILLLAIYIPLIYFLSKSIHKNLLYEIQMNDNLQENIDKLHLLSITDELTQLYNRRYFLETAQTILLHSQREQKPLSLLMIDVDYFKKLNDTYGHQLGDFILRELSNLLKTLVRKSDILARVGGEEFALLLQNTSLDGAKIIAEKIRISVAQHFFSYEGQTLQITLSIGVACENKSSIDLETLYKNADQNLYKAKASGRNQTSF